MCYIIFFKKRSILGINQNFPSLVRVACQKSTVNIIINGEIVGSFSLRREQDKHVDFHFSCSRDNRAPSQHYKGKRQCNDFQRRKKQTSLFANDSSSTYTAPIITTQPVVINEVQTMC